MKQTYYPLTQEQFVNCCNDCKAGDEIVIGNLSVDLVKEVIKAMKANK